MIVLVTCKNEEHPVKNEGARVFTTLYINFSDTQGQITLGLVVVSGADNSGVGGGIWYLIQAFMRVIVTCKNEYD